MVTSPELWFASLLPELAFELTLLLTSALLVCSTVVWVAAETFASLEEPLPLSVMLIYVAIAFPADRKTVTRAIIITYANLVVTLVLIQ